MANPSTFMKEPPYGAVQQLDKLQRSATMAGAAGVSSALNTPRRSQRQAVKGKQARRPPPAGTEAPLAPTPPPAAPVEPELPYAVSVQAVWEEIALHPEASPLAMRYLQKARELAGHNAAA
jgi:hypothetical protein